MFLFKELIRVFSCVLFILIISGTVVHSGFLIDAKKHFNIKSGRYNVSYLIDDLPRKADYIVIGDRKFIDKLKKRCDKLRIVGVAVPPYDISAAQSFIKKIHDFYKEDLIVHFSAVNVFPLRRGGTRLVGQKFDYLDAQTHQRSLFSWENFELLAGLPKNVLRNEPGQKSWTYRHQSGAEANIAELIELLHSVNTLGINVQLVYHDTQAVKFSEWQRSRLDYIRELEHADKYWKPSLKEADLQACN